MQVQFLEEGIPPVGSVLDGAYRIERLIGTGAMGAVLAAEDLALGRHVAVKVLRPGIGRQGESVLRFRREARAIARLHSPHAVRLHAFGVLDDGTCYLVMELVDGEPLTRLLRREAPLPLRRGLAILRAIAEVLEDAHASGVVHRDLKPDNVLVVRRGDEPDFVKVVDFGLARLGEAAELALTAHGAILGTPAYMAPEQIRGEVVDARADLYSLGAIAYEILLGRRPFERDSIPAMLFAHLHEDAPPPSELAPDLRLPRALEELLVQLLARTPGERPTGATEVLATLDGVLAEAPADLRPARTRRPGETDAEDDSPTMELTSWRFQPAYGETLAGTSTVSPGVLTPVVGREKEERRLDELLSELVRNHRPAVVLVTGDTGLGKSALVEALLAKAQAQRGIQVAVGRPIEGGVAPLRSLGEVAATLLGVAASDGEALRHRVAAAVPGAGAGEAGDEARHFFLRLLRPELDLDSTLPPLDAEAQRAFLLAHVRRLVYHAAGTRPLVLVFEDLDWAGEATRHVFADLADRLVRDPAPVLLIGTTSSLPGGSGGSLARLLAARRAPSDPPVAHLPLQPLGEDGTLALARQVLPVSDSLARTLHRLAAGNPHLVLQLARYLEEAGLVRESPSGWSLHHGVDVARLLPPDLRQVQALRVEQVLSLQRDPTLARRVLECAAVGGPRDPVRLIELMLAASGDPIPRRALEDVLDGLVTNEALLLEDDAVRFPSELVRQAVVAGLGTTFRARRLHAAAARAKEHLYGEALPRHAREVAEHHRNALAPTKALGLYVLAARTARRQANPREALECLEAAEALLDAAAAPPTERAEVRLELARLQRGFGQVEAAERTLLRAEEALLAAGDRAGLAEARLERAATLAARGDLATARALAEEVAAGTSTREARAAALARLGELCRQQGDLPAAIGHLGAAVRECPPEAAQLRALALLHLGLSHITAGDVAEADRALTACLAAHAGVQDPAGRARCLNALGVVAYLRGDSRLAQTRYRESLAIAERLGDQASVARCVMNLGTLHHKEARFAQAFEAYERSLSLFRAIGNRLEEAHVELNLGHALSEVGELVDAEEHLAAARRLYQTVGDRLGEATADAHRASVFARAGRTEPAHVLLTRSIAVAEELGADSHLSSFLVQLSALERDRGHRIEARAAAERGLALVVRQGRTGDEGIAVSALAATHGERPDELAESRRHLAGAREDLAAQSDWRHVIEVELRLGEVEAALGNALAAEAVLEQALARAEATGFLNNEVVRSYERLAVLARQRGDGRSAERAITRRDAAAARLVAGGGQVRSEARVGA